jgi:hypothetical protein
MKVQKLNKEFYNKMGKCETCEVKPLPCFFVYFSINFKTKPNNTPLQIVWKELAASVQARRRQAFRLFM